MSNVNKIIEYPDSNQIFYNDINIGFISKSLNDIMVQISKLNLNYKSNNYIDINSFPRYLNQKEVIAYLGHEKVFCILVDEYGLKPIRTEHKCNIYCSKQVDEKCIQFEHNIAV